MHVPILNNVGVFNCVFNSMRLLACIPAALLAEQTIQIDILLPQKIYFAQSQFEHFILTIWLLVPVGIRSNRSQVA